jgi:hypothetical protein
LKLEHGLSYGDSGDDVFSLNAAIAGKIENAQVKGTQVVLRSAIGYAAVSRSLSDGAAFETATKFLLANMLRSLTKDLEIRCLYGQVGLMEVGSISSQTITPAAGHWAPGIWAGAEDMKIEIRSADGLTLRGTANIVSTDFDNKTITVDVMPVGVVATDVVRRDGTYGKEFAGIHKIISNTGSLFNISAATYALWKGNTYNASGALSFNKIQIAVSKAVAKGLDGDVVVVVNPEVWADLLNDQAALRMYDSSYSKEKMEQGAKELKFHGQNGMIEILPSINCKEGFAYVLYMDDFVRIGSTDVTFQRPGRGDDFFRELENQSGYELRAYADYALFTFSPAKNVLVTGIT